MLPEKSIAGMILTPELKNFIATHLSHDTDKLLLNAKQYKEIPMAFAVDQILARRQVRDKLPTWYNLPDLFFPSRISAEQCSSELTARYKQSLLRGKKICDLTGGLGIDSWYFSQVAKEVIYIERLAAYCEAAASNFAVLKADNIQIIEADVKNLFPSLQADTFYIDPARRSGNNKRLFAITDCEPDILQFKNILLKKSQRLIVKISPMADLTETLKLIPEIIEIHIVAVRNECKEILLVLENKEPLPEAKVKIVTVNFTAAGEQQLFSFERGEEQTSDYHLTDTIKAYIYEPNSAILKSGAFQLISRRYLVDKLHRHSHLYTSDQRIEHFPGRIFKVKQVMEFSRKKLKQWGKQFPQANISVRNFPMSVAEIRKSSGISDGGPFYLFATTIGNARRILMDCEKA